MSNAPRVTPAALEAEIISESYINAGHAVGEVRTRTCPENFVATQALHCLTFCVLVLKNGFTVTGESACVSPENFNAETGRKIAREHAIEKLWPLLGFRLADRLDRED